MTEHLLLRTCRTLGIFAIALTLGACSILKPTEKTEAETRNRG